MKWIETVRTIAATRESERGAAPPDPVPAGWDPYDVWLNRVHAPRAARVRRAQRPGTRPARDGAPAA